MNFRELLSSNNIKHALIYLSIIGISVFTTKACTGDDPIPIVAPVPVLEPTKEFVDINNKIHNVITQQAIEKEEQKDYVDSLKTVLKVKDEDIKEVTKLTQSIDTGFTVKSEINSSSKDTIYSVHKKDNWIDISAFAGRDSGKILLGLTDTLTYTSVRKRGLFNTYNYVDIYHTNPYITTRKGYSITFKERQAIITIGPSIGYGYNGRGFSPYFGISATFPVLRIK